MASTPRFYDRVLETSTTTGTGAYTLAGAVTGFQSFADLGDGKSAFYYAEAVDADGIPSGDWEVGLGTFTSAGTTLSRDQILASSNADAAVSWGAGTKRIAITTPAANTINTRHIFEARLGLVPGDSLYYPVKALTPNATDTGAETVTFAAVHNWKTGTLVSVDATAGGLTLGTTYYINATSTTAISFHTTLANAIAAASPVNLTASITARVVAFGVASQTIYLTPFGGDRIRLFNGTRWITHVFEAEVSLALGTLTSGGIYSIYAYDNAGTVALELGSAWAGDTTPEALVLQDGIAVKSGTTTRLYIGTLRMNSTTDTILLPRDGYITATATLDLNLGVKVYLSNAYSQRHLSVKRMEPTASWTYSTATWRQARATTANQLDLVLSIDPATIDKHAHGVAATIASAFFPSGAGQNAQIAIGLDSTTVPSVEAAVNILTATSGLIIPLVSQVVSQVTPGRHVFTWLESGNGTGTQTFRGSNVTGGVVVDQSMISARLVW